MSSNNPVLIAGGVPSNQSVYEVATSPRHEPGTKGVLSDGRLFEYVRSDHATAIGHGKLATYVPIVASLDGLAVQAAAAIGATSISVTVNPAEALVANELWGGFIAIDDDAGEGEMYKIVGHDAKAASSGTFTVQIDRPVVTALTTSTTASLIYGPCAVKISAAVTAQNNPVEVAAGITLVDVPAGDTTAQYFWVQKSGLANVLFSAAVGAVGQVCYPGAVAGSVQVANLDTDSADAVQMQAVGTIYALLPVSTEYAVVNLSIP